MDDSLAIGPFETYEIENPGDRIRTAQRITLLYLSHGDELWVAVAKAIGLDPSLTSQADELRCTRLGMRWMEDPEIERITDQLHRAATAGLRLLRMRAVQRMGRTLASTDEKVSYRAAKDILQYTESSAAVSPAKSQTAGPSGMAQRRAQEERERLKVRMKARKILNPDVPDQAANE